jgi:hypothetical protein
MPPLQPYATVRVIAVREDRFAGEKVFYRRSPEVGDIGTIIETYVRPELAYEVECSDPASGETIWLDAMYPDEVEAWPT